MVTFEISLGKEAGDVGPVVLAHREGEDRDLPDSTTDPGIGTVPRERAFLAPCFRIDESTVAIRKREGCAEQVGGQTTRLLCNRSLDRIPGIGMRVG